MPARPSPRAAPLSRRAFVGRAALGAAGLAVFGPGVFGGCSRARQQRPTPRPPSPYVPPEAEPVSTDPFPPPPGRPLFESFFLAGYECSTHFRRDGRRLDLLASTRHDALAARDYARLRDIGITACRDGVRWHLVDRGTGEYDFSSFLPMLRAARAQGVQVMWDLFHYGYPDDLDAFGPRFVDRYARYAAACARVIRDETPAGEPPPMITPVNEISFLSWAGGDQAHVNPHARGRGLELKVQLVRAAVAGMHAIRDVIPGCRFMHCDPMVHLVPRTAADRAASENYRLGQFQAWDMLGGYEWPQLGGRPDFLDLLGVNYYFNNQTYFGGEFILRGHPDHRPFREFLVELWNRYRRPVIVAETGIEDAPRPEWLRYMCGEAAAAMRRGVQLHGLTWYPILNHPGWEDDRHCRNGLWDYADASGHRPIHEPLAAEMARLAAEMTALRADVLSGRIRPATTATTTTKPTATAPLRRAA